MLKWATPAVLGALTCVRATSVSTQILEDVDGVQIDPWECSDELFQVFLTPGCGTPVDSNAIEADMILEDDSTCRAYFEVGEDFLSELRQCSESESLLPVTVSVLSPIYESKVVDTHLQETETSLQLLPGSIAVSTELNSILLDVTDQYGDFVDIEECLEEVQLQLVHSETLESYDAEMIYSIGQSRCTATFQVPLGRFLLQSAWHVHWLDDSHDATVLDVDFDAVMDVARVRAAVIQEVFTPEGDVRDVKYCDGITAWLRTNGTEEWHRAESVSNEATGSCRAVFSLYHTLIENDLTLLPVLEHSDRSTQQDDQVAIRVLYGPDDQLHTAVFDWSDMHTVRVKAPVRTVDVPVTVLNHVIDGDAYDTYEDELVRADNFAHDTEWALTACMTLGDVRAYDRADKTIAFAAVPFIHDDDGGCYLRFVLPLGSYGVGVAEDRFIIALGSYGFELSLRDMEVTAREEKIGVNHALQLIPIAVADVGTYADTDSDGEEDIVYDVAAALTELMRELPVSDSPVDTLAQQVVAETLRRVLTTEVAEDTDSVRISEDDEEREAELEEEVLAEESLKVEDESDELTEQEIVRQLQQIYDELEQLTAEEQQQEEEEEEEEEEEVLAVEFEFTLIADDDSDNDTDNSLSYGDNSQFWGDSTEPVELFVVPSLEFEQPLMPAPLPMGPLPMIPLPVPMMPPVFF
ncbi:MAG: hypothetical protein MHM6MM_001454 [Cercozoa sp. M6MM]